MEEMKGMKVSLRFLKYFLTLELKYFLPGGEGGAVWGPGQLLLGEQQQSGGVSPGSEVKEVEEVVMVVLL